MELVSAAPLPSAALTSGEEAAAEARMPVDTEKPFAGRGLQIEAAAAPVRVGRDGSNEDSERVNSECLRNACDQCSLHNRREGQGHSVSASTNGDGHVEHEGRLHEWLYDGRRGG